MPAISWTRYRYNCINEGRKKGRKKEGKRDRALSRPFFHLLFPVLLELARFSSLLFASLSAGFVFTRRVDCLDYRSTTLTTAWELIGTTSLAADIDDHRERDPRVFVCTRKKILFFYLAR